MTTKDSANKIAQPGRQVVLDTETTGLVGARLVSIGMLEMIDGKPTGKTFYRIVNPEVQMDDFVISIHRITNEMAAQEPTFAAIAKDVRDFIGDSQVVITCRTHEGVTLDIAVLNDELTRTGQREVPAGQWLNVRRWSEEMFGSKGARLDALLDRYNVSRAQRDAEGHGALLDAQLLAAVYAPLLKDYLMHKRVKPQNKQKPPSI